MKNNAELQKNVQDAIKWQPFLNAAEIGVTMKQRFPVRYFTKTFYLRIREIGL